MIFRAGEEEEHREQEQDADVFESLKDGDAEWFGTRAGMMTPNKERRDDHVYAERFGGVARQQQSNEDDR